MKTCALVLLGLLVGAAGQAGAQQVPPPVLPPATPPPATTQPPVAAPAVAAPAAVTPPVVIDKQRRREQIGGMEGLLEKAVKLGATDTARQVQGMMMIMSGNARARGFELEGYGVFFHVEVPGVGPSMAALLDMYERQERQRAEPQPRPMGSVSGPPNIDAMYTQAVQMKLVDAMLSYRIDLRADEWLTVAARDADTPVPQGVISETFTIILRMKGSDLADFFAGRVSREEAVRKVQVREF